MDYIGKYNNQYNKNFHLLKYYFNVNNSYVINKMKLLLFPFTNKYWKRRIQNDEYLPPRDDINAPDLYIPTMSFVTYILLLGFVMGSAYRFTPEVLGKTATSGLIVLGVEVFAIKFGLYLLNAFTVSFLDLISYCGYKYVGIVLTILGGFIFGRYGYYSLMLVTSLFNAIFMVRTLKHVFPEGSDASRNYFLLGVAALQLVFGYYLSYDVTTI